MKFGYGQLNYAILDFLDKNREWFTCEDIAKKLDANILSVRSSMSRFSEIRLVELKKDKVLHSRGLNRLYFYKHNEGVVSNGNIFKNMKAPTDLIK